MNCANLIGRLTKDPEVRWNNDLAICRFALAVNRPPRKGEDAGADFINVVVFGKQAENCEKYLAKGSQLAVQGRIQTGSYEKDGHRKYTFDVIADRIEFLGKKPENSEPVYEGFSAIDMNDIPF